MEKKPDLVLNWTNFYFYFFWKWQEFKVLKIQKTHLKIRSYFITNLLKKKKKKKNKTKGSFWNQEPDTMYIILSFLAHPLSELESIPEESCRLYTVHTDDACRVPRRGVF